MVGIRKPSIHHHFASKIDLVRVLVARYVQEAEAGLAHLARQVSDPLEQLRSYMGYWAKCIQDASVSFCLCALLASELPVLPTEVAVEVKAYFRMLSAWLTSVMEHGQRSGRLALTNTPHIEAEAFMATVHGAMLSARIYGNSDTFIAVTDRLIEGLCPREAPARGC